MKYLNLRKSLKDNIFYECELNYNTPRGKWYDYSWKGNSEKSGGILYNIGIHLFDILIWIFGECLNFEIHMKMKLEMLLVYFTLKMLKLNGIYL